MCPIRPIEPDGKWGNKQRREYVLDEDGNQIELKEDENALDTFNLSRMDADDDRRSRYANEEELADAGFDYVPEEEVEASYDGADDEF